MRDAASIRQMAWCRQFIPRATSFWLFKAGAITIFMLVFFAAYFWLLNHPKFPVTQMPVTLLDRLVGFHPVELALYLSLWAYVSLAPAFLLEKSELVAYWWSSWGLGLAGCAVFFFWPTSTPVPDIDWERYPSFGFLKSVDHSGNACPSLHVAFAVLSGIWADRVLREMRCPAWLLWLNWAWCLGIVHSTMATKQHVALDVVAGVALGVAWFFVHLRLILPLVRGSRRGMMAASGQ